MLELGAAADAPAAGAEPACAAIGCAPIKYGGRTLWFISPFANKVALFTCPCEALFAYPKPIGPVNLDMP